MDKIIKFDQFFYNKELNDLKNEEIKSKNFCNKIINKYSYKCLDCVQWDNVILCEECFKNSEHMNHNFHYKSNSNGTCDCGNKEVLNPTYDCKFHNGKETIEDNLNEDLKNEIVKNWKNKLFIIFKELSYLLRGKNSNYTLNDIIEILDSFIFLNNKNIIIIKLLTISLSENLKNINEEDKIELNNMLFNVNKEILESKGHLLSIEDFNLIDIILTLNHNIVQKNKIKEFIYSMFDSISFKYKLSKSYIRIFYKISKQSYIIKDFTKLDLNFQLMIYKSNNWELFKSKYFKNFLKGFYYFNKKGYFETNFNFNEYLSFLNGIEYIEHYLFLIPINSYYWMKIILKNFIKSFSITFNDKSITYNHSSIDIFLNFYYYFERCFIHINEINDTVLINKVYKQLIQDTISIQIKYYKKTYKKELWKIDINDLNNCSFLLFENIISTLISYFVVYNNLLNTNINNFKEIIIDLLELNNDDHKNLLIIYLLNIVKYNRNFIKISVFYLKNNYNLFELIKHNNYKFLKEYNIFLLQIIKLILGDEKFIDWFISNFFNKNLENKDFLNDYINKENNKLITYFNYYVLENPLELENIEKKENKEIYYNEYLKLLSEADLENFKYLKNKYYNLIFKEFFDYINKIGNYPILIEKNLIKINNMEDIYLTKMVLNYFKIVKKQKIGEFMNESKKLIYFILINYNKNLENKLKKIIFEHLNFDKESSFISTKTDDDNNLDQSILILNNSFLVSKLIQLEDMNKFNIINNKNLDIRFINKDKYIRLVNLILFENIFGNFITENPNINEEFLDNLDNFILNILFLLNSEKTKYIELIKTLKSYSNESNFFNIILNIKDNKELDKVAKNKLKSRNLDILDKLDNIKTFKLKKFLLKKTNSLKVNEDKELCFICKKEFIDNKTFPIQIIEEKLSNNEIIYNISSCKHFFHINCNTEYTNNYNCWYCKKNYYLLLINNNDFNNEIVYLHNIKVTEYFLNYHLEFKSLTEELIKIYIFRELNDSLLDELLINNILSCFSKIYGFDIIKKIYDYILSTLDSKNLSKEYLDKIDLFKNRFENFDISFLIKYFDLILVLLKKIEFFENYNYNKIMEDFVFKILKKCNKNENYNYILNDLNLSISKNKIIFFNKKFENLKIINLNNKLYSNKNIIDSIKLEDNFNKFQISCNNIKCKYCDTIIFKFIISYCLLCKEYFCYNKFCPDILDSMEDYINTETVNKIKNNFNYNNKLNIIIHNKAYHSNYGLYYNINSNEAFILYNKNLYNKTNLYINNWNIKAQFNDYSIAEGFKLDKVNLNKLIDCYLKKELNSLVN